jgi:hypothetical protein
VPTLFRQMLEQLVALKEGLAACRAASTQWAKELVPLYELAISYQMDTIARAITHSPKLAYVLLEHCVKPSVKPSLN